MGFTKRMYRQWYHRRGSSFSSFRFKYGRMKKKHRRNTAPATPNEIPRMAPMGSFERLRPGASFEDDVKDVDNDGDGKVEGDGDQTSAE